MPRTAGLIRRWAALPVMLAVLGLAACGSSSGSGGGFQPVPPVAGPTPTPTPTPPPPQGPLTGDASGLAKTAIQTVDVGDTYTPAEISVGPAGEEVIRTKLQIVFRPDATVGQVNGLLNDLDARITTSIAGIETVVVRIADPGSLAALESAIDRIESDSFVWFVSRSILPTTDGLPANVAPDHGKAIDIRHHLAIGAAGAWSARQAIVHFPRVFIVDFFGDGAPNGDLEYAYVGDAASDFATGRGNQHGYHVAGIIAGRFGGADIARARVTGMMPEAVRLTVIDETIVDPLDTMVRLLARLSLD